MDPFTVAFPFQDFLTMM